MAASQPLGSNSDAFGVRIVSLDYYMAPPIHDLDFCYSSFQGGAVKEVPVIRVYGPTLTGQKTCLHVHKVLPYLYIPCTDISIQSTNMGSTYLQTVGVAVEKALSYKSSVGLKKQHVHECSFVCAKRLYGYYSSEELFVKIYLYHPNDIARAATLFLQGAILEKIIQPFESHIPFLLQFMVDYNLYGMSHLRTSKVKFRHSHLGNSIPSASREGDDIIQSVRSQANSSFESMERPELSLPSTVLRDLPSKVSSPRNDGSEDKIIHVIKRQSICDLEGDICGNDILNQTAKLYTSFSQTKSDVKMVPSLIPIWEEEFERTGLQDPIKTSDDTRPSSETTLRRFLDQCEYDAAFSKMCTEAQFLFSSNIADTGSERNSLYDPNMLFKTSCTVTDANGPRANFISGEPMCINEASHDEFVSSGRSEEDVVNAHSTEMVNCYTEDCVLSAELTKSASAKVIDTEAIRLLNWLASSQAAEEINSDDEFGYEVILSPLLPTKDYKKMLEKANLEYESASQKECQDILDSIAGIKLEGLKDEPMSSVGSEYPGASSDFVIPQVDGSSDDQFPGMNANYAGESSTSYGEGGNTSRRLHAKFKRNKHLWGTLPFATTIGHTNLDNYESSISADTNADLTFDCSSRSSCYKDDQKNNFKISQNLEKSPYMEVENFMVGSSLRDLMRKKRCLQSDLSECATQKTMSPIVEQRRTGSGGAVEHASKACSLPIMPSEAFDVGSSCNIHYGAALTRVFSSDYILTACTELDKSSGLHERNNGEYFMPSALPLSLADRNPHAPNVQFGNTPSTMHTEQLNTFQHAVSDFGSCKGVVPGVPNKNLESDGDQLNCRLPSASCNSNGFDDYAVHQGPSISNCRSDQVSHVCRSDQSSDFIVEGLVDISNGNANINPGVFHETLQRELKTAEQEMRMCSSSSDCFSHAVDNMAGNSSGYIKMTFGRKPPSVDQLFEGSEYNPYTILEATESLINSNVMTENLLVPKNFDQEDVLACPPFFYRSFRERTGGSHSSGYHEDAQDIPPESAVGVPVYYQNDGSLLYLLTYAISPPSSHSVGQWILGLSQKGNSKLNIPSIFEHSSVSEALGHRVNRNDTDISGKTLLKSQKLHRIVSSDVGSAQVLKLIDSSKTSGEDVVGCDFDLIMGHSSQKDLLKSVSECNQPELINTDARVSGSQTMFIDSEGREVINNWHDVSQISGPFQRSKLTPLSQSGFRDPASVGGGQQLTLISIEIQAESRGDLRPDPRIDAVNVIILVIQMDNHYDTDVYVLLRSPHLHSLSSNADGICRNKLIISSDEKCMFDHLTTIIQSIDPDILMGWEIQSSSLGFLAERAAYLGVRLLKNISRTCLYGCNNENRASMLSEKEGVGADLSDAPLIDSVSCEESLIEDEWGRTHASGIHVAGRIVLNLWRLMRSEVKLNMYTIESVAEEVLHQKIPSIPCKVLNHWFSDSTRRATFRCIDYIIERAKLNIAIANQLDLINRTSELARIFGIDFFSVLSRGSQFRVESMLLRLAHTQNYLAISPGPQQVASQPAMECLPLVMEPHSGFYSDPVVVLDFQSLYPSMIIAYNLCFSTCLGKVMPPMPNVLGVTSYYPDRNFFLDSKQQILLCPNGVMYVPSQVRKGVLPRLLEEILSTRIMVKQAMKKLLPAQRILQRIFNARQLALKLIANVTYGYTAAGFSGRMPCAELADSIVQCGRRTLETAISFVNAHEKWNAKVVYGDTDSMFVHLRGRSLEEAFKIGKEIASSITLMNPDPVTLKLEKVYQPCFLLTKKRYVGYSYESPGQKIPMFDAKGIETVRRDTCPAVAKILEHCLRIYFENQDILKVKIYLQRQWSRILSGKVSLQDFIFAKEVRLGTYSANASSLPPSAIVAIKKLRSDPRSEPHYAERVPYIVVHGEPGSRLADMVVDPLELLDLSSTYRLNDTYYINKQIIPPLQRVFGLVGADLKKWLSEIPRLTRPALTKRQPYLYNDDQHTFRKHPKRGRIDSYYLSKHCNLCGEFVQSSVYLCDDCSKRGPVAAAAIIGKTSNLEKEIQHLSAICRHCGGGDWIIENGVKCNSLACSVFYERRKVQKELQVLSAVATETGLYPRCMVEWF